MSKPLVHQITERARGLVADPRSWTAIRHCPDRQQPALRADRREGRALLRLRRPPAGRLRCRRQRRSGPAARRPGRHADHGPRQPRQAFEELIAINDGPARIGAQGHAGPVRQGAGQGLTRLQRFARVASMAAIDGGGAGARRRRRLCWCLKPSPARAARARDIKPSLEPMSEPTRPNQSAMRRTTCWKPRAPGSTRTAASRSPP